MPPHHHHLCPASAPSPLQGEAGGGVQHRAGFRSQLCPAVQMTAPLRPSFSTCLRGLQGVTLGRTAGVVSSAQPSTHQNHRGGAFQIPKTPQDSSVPKADNHWCRYKRPARHLDQSTFIFLNLRMKRVGKSGPIYHQQSQPGCILFKYFQIPNKIPKSLAKVQRSQEPCSEVRRGLL